MERTTAKIVRFCCPVKGSASTRQQWFVYGENRNSKRSMMDCDLWPAGTLLES